MAKRPKTLTVYIGGCTAYYFTGAFTVYVEPHEDRSALTVTQGRHQHHFVVKNDIHLAIAKVRHAGEIVAHAEMDD